MQMNTQSQKFGGPWTEQKLECVRKYLHAYTTIMRKQRFHFAYIDAFAGTGSWKPPKETQELLDGSPRIALQVEPPFNKYVFIEKNQQKYSKLLKLEIKFPSRPIEVINTEAITS